MLHHSSQKSTFKNVVETSSYLWFKDRHNKVSDRLIGFKFGIDPVYNQVELPSLETNRWNNTLPGFTKNPALWATIDSMIFTGTSVKELPFGFEYESGWSRMPAVQKPFST